MTDTANLKFHDGSPDDDILFDKEDLQTHTFTNFPHSHADDDDDVEADKSQLLKEEKKAPSLWTFEYYQQFFDVETRQVFTRVAGSMVPLPHRNYLESHIRPNPDLYGPFWICTTLVFTTAIAGNLANYLSSGGKDYQWKYDFHKVTFAATAIFSYWWAIPTLLYGLLWWRRSQAGYTFLEIICVYGYSLAIYIPISILWVVNVTWFKWSLVILGALLSGGVLVRTFWPAVRDDTRRVAVIVIFLIFLFHTLLAAGFVMYFFHVPPPANTMNTTVAPAVTPHVNLPEAVHESENSPQNLALKSGRKPDSVSNKGPGALINKGPLAQNKGTLLDTQENKGAAVVNKESKGTIVDNKEGTNAMKADGQGDKKPVDKGNDVESQLPSSKTVVKPGKRDTRAGDKMPAADKPKNENQVKRNIARALRMKNSRVRRG